MPNGAPTTRPEKTRLRLGFIALADCAPLVVARELGFLADEGLDVSLERQGSWAAIRDRVILGRLDGAQMLAGLPLAATLGLGTPPQPMVAAMSLGLNGNSITVASELWARMRAADACLSDDAPAQASALAQMLAADRAEGLAPLTFAVVHPVSSHNYQLRYWLAAGGIDPDRDVRIIVVPPARMLANLRAGRIAGYCVGAPWSELAVAEGMGHIALTGYELWHNAPEKVLGVTRTWAEAYPATHRALIRGLVQACRWLGTPDNRARIAPLIASPDYVDCDAAALASIYAGRLRRHVDGDTQAHPNHLVFADHQANFPWRSHAIWFMRQMQRWGQLHPAIDVQTAALDVYRPDIYREVAASLGLSAPSVDYKSEGGHAGPWTPEDELSDITLGPDLFLDGGQFDPQAPAPIAHLYRSSVSTIDQGNTP